MNTFEIKCNKVKEKELLKRVKEKVKGKQYNSSTLEVLKQEYPTLELKDEETLCNLYKSKSKLQKAQASLFSVDPLIKLYFIRKVLFKIKKYLLKNSIKKQILLNENAIKEIEELAKKIISQN
ncbi:MAG: hypothetical protein PHE49_11365 [bacterium]|nr:hypothetical protein [bacterium]